MRRFLDLFTRRTLVSLGLGFLFFFLLIAPDLIFKAIKGSAYPLYFEMQPFMFALAFGVLFSFSSRLIPTIAVLLLLSVFQLMQFCSLAYFGTGLAPYALLAMFVEAGDVTEEVMSAFFRYAYLALVVLLPFALLFFVWKKTSSKRQASAIGSVLLIIAMLLFPIRVVVKQRVPIIDFAPIEGRLSFYNTLRTFSAFFFRIVPQTISGGTPDVTFNPYTVSVLPSSDQPITIVLMVGEGVNPFHMSLFGYSRKTTPLLDSLARKDKGFIHTVGLTSSVTTLNAFTMLMSLQREPLNYKVSQTKAFHLLKFAKQAGFTTSFITAQDRKMMIPMYQKELDRAVFIQEDAAYESKREELFIPELKKLPLGKKNLIVIQQRNIHVPYARNYAYRKADFEKFPPADEQTDQFRIDTYDNAMTYFDYIMTGLFDYFEKEFTTPVYFFFVSDHNEILGENGRWGHTILLKECAPIPVFFKGFHVKDSVFTERIRSLFAPTHYEIGKLILEKIGYKLNNPNEKENVFYLNGLDTAGRDGFIRITKDPKKKEILFSDPLYKDE